MPARITGEAQEITAENHGAVRGTQFQCRHFG